MHGRYYFKFENSGKSCCTRKTILKGVDFTAFKRQTYCVFVLFALSTTDTEIYRDLYITCP